MSKGISVIICCYNSATRLPKTLEYLANQRFPILINWEIIIVDNNSSDGTAEVAAREWKNKAKAIDFIIIKEESPGLSYARHKGVLQAKHEYILFCDDDNWLQDDYLNRAITLIDAHPEIGALGGQGIVVADITLPDWWEDYATGFAVGKQNEKNGFVDKRGYLWGAGLITKKKLYLNAFEEFPSLLSDRKGAILNSGGDAEYCARVLMMGYRLYYDENLKFYHFMEAQRLTWDYKKKMFQGHQKSEFILNCFLQIINSDRKPVLNKVKTLLKFPFKCIIYGCQLNKKGLQILLKDLYVDWQLDFIPFQHNTLRRVVAIKKSLKKHRQLHVHPKY